MTAPTSVDLADAIVRIQNAANQLEETAEGVSRAIQAAVTEVEEAAGRFDLEGLAEEADVARDLAEELSKLHADEHEGPLRWCTRLACRMADEVLS